MKKILHIIATPRGESSRTLKISSAFLDAFKKKYPDCIIDEINLYKESLPELTAKKVDGKYILLGGGDLSGEFADEWRAIVEKIEHFLSYDAYLLSVPMWNFGIPYVLKHYIDVIAQPKYLFKYTANGPVGLAKNKKMLVVTSRGGDYSEASPFYSYDFQEPYLRAIFGFVGITDIKFINAQPMDALGPEVREDKIKSAQGEARSMGEVF